MNIEYFALMLGVVSVIYFMVRTAIVRPARLKFSVFWIIFGISAIAVSLICHFSDSMFMSALCYAVAVICIIMALGVMLIVAFACHENRKSGSMSPDYILILGVHYPSDEFNVRVSRALEVWRKKRDARFICSGGKTRRESMSEAAAMKSVLIAAGVPQSNIMTDEESISTFQNLKNASSLLKDSNSKLAIVTSDYHLLRATIMAKNNGLINASAVPAGYFGISWVNYAIRELIFIPVFLIKKY